MANNGGTEGQSRPLGSEWVQTHYEDTGVPGAPGVDVLHRVITRRIPPPPAQPQVRSKVVRPKP